MRPSVSRTLPFNHGKNYSKDVGRFFVAISLTVSISFISPETVRTRSANQQLQTAAIPNTSTEAYITVDMLAVDDKNNLITDLAPDELKVREEGQLVPIVTTFPTGSPIPLALLARKAHDL